MQKQLRYLLVSIFNYSWYYSSLSSGPRIKKYSARSLRDWTPIQ